MAEFDEVDDTGKQYKNINDEIKNQNESLRDQLSITRELTNLSQKMSQRLGDDVVTRKSIISLSYKLENILQHHVNHIDEQVKGLRSVNTILKDRNVIEDSIRRLSNESDLAFQSHHKTLEEVRETQRKIDAELAKAIVHQNKKRLDELRTEKAFLAHKQASYLGISKVFKNQMDDQSVLLENLAREEQLVKNVNKSLGLAPQLLDGIDKTLRKHSFGRFAESLNISGALNRTRLGLANAALANGGAGGKPPGALKAAGMLAGNLANNLGKALTKANLLTAALIAVADGVLDADKAQAELQQKLSISRADARVMRMDFAKMANESGNIFVNLKGIQESSIAINTSLGTSAKLTGQILVDYTELTKQGKFSAEAALLLTKYALIQNTRSKELLFNINKEIGAYKGRTGVLLNERKIVEDIAKVSAGAAAIMGNQVETLARTVATASALGLTMSQIERSASSLTEFESSISAELEAQLMTGKDINLSKAREFAMIGDYAGVAREITQQVGSLAEFQKMNVFQAEALAKSVGMTRDDLAKQLLDVQVMRKLNMDQAKTVQEAWQMAVKTHTLEGAKKLLGNEQLANQLQAISNQEKWVAMGEKLLEIFTQIGDILQPIFNVLTDIVEVFISPIVKGVQMVWDLFRNLGKELGLVSDNTNIWGDVLKGIGQAIEVMIVGPLQALSVLLDIVFRTFNSIGKLVSGDFKGALNAFDEKTAFTLKPEDNVITKYIHFADGGIVTKPTRGLVGEAGPEAIIPLGKLDQLSQLNNNNESIEELKELNRNIRSLLGVVKSGQNIYFDSYKVGTALALGSMKTQ